MKYIIELSKEVKEKFDNATKDEIYGSYYDYNSVIGNAIKNGTPLSEELEKIKAEITEYRNNIHAGNDEFHIGRLLGCDEAVELIDKHIAELKGE